MSSRVMNALSRAANKPSNRSRGPSRSLLLPLMTVLLVKAAAQGAANTPSTAVAVDMMQQQQQKPQVQLIRRSLVADSAAAATSADTAAAAASTDARSIPVYGNWCGPNYGSGTPVDELDDCCRGHDNCYDSTAVYNHCSCDQQLVRCLNKIVSIKSNELVKRAIRASMVTYFDNAACRCSMETDMCMPVKNCVCSG